MRSLASFAFLLAAALSPLGAQATPAAAPAVPGQKSPTAARVLAVIPAAGHVYAGESGRGLAYLGGMAGLFAAGALVVAADCVGDMWGGGSPETCGETPATVFGLAIYGVYGWSIYDAGRAAQRTNARRTPASPSGPSVILAPTRTAASPTRDVTGVKLGLSLTTR